MLSVSYHIWIFYISVIVVFISNVTPLAHTLSTAVELVLNLSLPQTPEETISCSSIFKKVFPFCPSFLKTLLFQKKIFCYVQCTPPKRHLCTLSLSSDVALNKYSLAQYISQYIHNTSQASSQ